MNNLWSDFLSILRDGYRNWNIYSARSSRKEFWMWALHVWLAAIATTSLENSIEGASLLFLLPLIPSFAMFVRRIHDTGHRVWWCIMPFLGGIISLVLLLSATDTTETRWVRPEERPNQAIA